jgi:penicillin-binding protein 2
MRRLPFDIDQFNPKVFRRDMNSIRDSFGFSDLSNSLPKKLQSFELSEQYKQWHVMFFSFVVIVTTLIFITRAFSLQVLTGEKYVALSKSNNTRYAQIQAERGVIYSREGNVLVRNKPAFSVELNTMYCNELDICESTIYELEKILNKSLPEAYLDLAARKQIIVVEKGLSKDEVLPIESKLSAFPGLVVTVQPLRDYPYSEAFAHVLGYVGLDSKSLQPRYVGKAGLEEYYDEAIRGIPGERVIQVDSAGESYKIIAEQNAFPGKNIHTYLNLEIQNKAYELIKQKVLEGKATAGVAVAQDPQTGGVIALVSYPTYDSEKMSYGMTNLEMDELLKAGNYPFFNRAISAVYPPGSTFKMVTASGALTEKVITPHTIIFDPGYVQVGSYIFRNWKLDGHGDVNLIKALQVSNDTYFYSVGGGHNNIKGLGIEKLALWAKKFGYGKNTGVDLVGELPGHMPDGTGRDWYLGDTYITSIGQGDVLSTPLQVNNVTTYFANGGILYEPKIVESIDGLSTTSAPVIAENLTDTEIYTLVREGMAAVAAPGGTAYPFFDFPQKHNGVVLAAKTGTSEFTDPQGEEKTHAWITAFGPYTKGDYNSTIAVTVFLEGGGAGSDDATPIAREMLDIWFK